MSFWLQSKLEVGGRPFWGWMEIELHEGNEEWHFVREQTGKTREEHYLGREGDAWAQCETKIHDWCDRESVMTVGVAVWYDHCGLILVVIFAEEEGREVKVESKGCSLGLWNQGVG